MGGSESRGYPGLRLIVFFVLLSLCHPSSGAQRGANAAKSKSTALFLTVKSSNFCIAKFDHITSGYLLLTDIMISPDGVPLEIFKENCVCKKQPGLKIIISLGGSVVPSELFAYLASDETRRPAFCDNLVEFVLSHGFHGIDLSWLYPSPQERHHYVNLLRDLRLACDRNGLILTVTVPSRPSVIEVNYPVEKLEKYCDFVILSTTEYRKLRKTSFIAPLYSCSPGSSNSIDYHVDRWKTAGLSSSKIVIVIQTMTLTYKLYIPNEYRIGTPALQLKIRPYYKICRKLYSGSLEIWDSNAKSPYAFRDLSWYSYENEKSIKEKVGFVVQQRLGGLAVFYYDEDDPINICGDGQYPMTAMVIGALQSDYQPPAVISEPPIYPYEAPSIGYSIARASELDSFLRFAEGEGSRGEMVQVPSAPPTAPRRTQTINSRFENLALVSDSPMTDDDLFLKQAFDWDDDFDEQEEFVIPSTAQATSTGNSPSFADVLSGNDRQSAVAVVDNENQGPVAQNSVQLFSEPDRSSSLQLFSEQSSAGSNQRSYGAACKRCGSPLPSPCHHCRHNIPHLSYGETCSKCDSDLPIPPCHHCSPVVPPPKPCVQHPAGVRFFAVAQNPTTPKPTTTTMAPPPPPVHFYAVSSAINHKPPSSCLTGLGFNSPVQFVATAHGSAPPCASTPLPPPPPPPPPAPLPCPMVKLYSENLPTPQQANPGIGVQFHAVSVGNQPVPSPGAFVEKICPHDGILQDPYDRRSYYLCKRGLPMCDENKFHCAHGYIFDAAGQKCVPERAYK
ncbi:uncharacterized protein LOC126576582 [Anopheles aquasalis]|uniref:uncharacterized protein LOC126576582 n=1 Tax=Anopheles aquasalis TaxID=42839 RepID=UPI00215AC8C2|nr:uncharacterized protein LOC126576582 [Anopheles aquasalis]